MKKFWYLSVLSLGLLTSCGGQKAASDDANVVRIAIDETFRPIMEEEIKVFKSLNPGVEVKADYMNERDALNLLLKDSIQMVVSTRILNAKENKSLLDNFKLQPRYHQIATDGVALIVNRDNNDTLLSVSDLRQILMGQVTRWDQLKGRRTKGDLQLVFDNPNSSTVRFVRDSICGGKEITSPNVHAQKTNEEVIDYVAKTRNAIGVVGVDWLKDPSDSSRLKFQDRVRLMSISASATADSDNSFLPYQYYIATGEYPLTRGIFMITTDPKLQSAGIRFFFFVTDTSGQLIITKSSQLLPYMPVQVKTVNVKDEN